MPNTFWTSVVCASVSSVVIGVTYMFNQKTCDNTSNINKNTTNNDKNNTKMSKSKSSPSLISHNNQTINSNLVDFGKIKNDSSSTNFMKWGWFK